MNVLQIKIFEDGTLECSPDFKIIRGGYRNILLKVEIPHSLLLDPVIDEAINKDITGNFVRVAAIIRTSVGKNLQTQKYELEPVEDYERDGKMYRLYQRLMPKEFTLWETVSQFEKFCSGKLELVFNVVNWTMTESEETHLQTNKIESIASSPILKLDVYPGGYLEDAEAVENPQDYAVIKERVDNVEISLNNAENDIKALQTKDNEFDLSIKALQAKDDEIITNTAYQVQAVQNKAEEDLNQLREEVNEKPYFYGWFNNVDDLITNYPQATENDYAYIIGGNIYEYHDNQWIDTGNKTPDNIAPLSDDEPLPVGDVASAGTSNQASKWDHVHKENEQTRADIDKNTSDIAVNRTDIIKKVDKSQIVQTMGQSTTNIMSQKAITDLINPPIGSILIYADDTQPASIYGGTWEKIVDRFLIGAGGKYTLGNTGGEQMHILSWDEMPQHTHPLLNHYDGGPNIGNSRRWETVISEFGEISSYGVTSAGASQPHNNMPPYLAVNIWKRIA